MKTGAMKCGSWLAAVLLLFASPSVAAKTYSASGLILHVDRANRSVEVSCRAIPGYMDAMVMTLPVHTTEALNKLKPGMIIDFKLTVRKDAAYAEDIRVHAYENSAQEPMAARQLEILEAATGAPSRTEPTLEVGQAVPDFTLIDQKRESITLSHLAGKVVAITFIYTRCPLPTFCFRMSNNFGVLHRRFADRMGKDLVLLSITFDPEHDQPDVLAEYARTWTTDQTGWHFLTGPLADVQKVCRSFGVNSWQEEGFITHPLHTVLVDRQGRIVANIEGNEYTAKQLGDLVEAIINRPKLAH
ncbi:MAG TPA: SCO family protein [Candidatus Acidoferrales bacterium]|nr:SCO family protein [Candidatus Acidoferrales bacterium]